MPYVTKNIKDMIKTMEGYSEKSYVDASGRSIGYGHFIQPGEQLEGKSLSKDEAEKLLEEDIQKHQDPWIGKLRKDAGETEIAALTSFAYNVGAHGAVHKAVELINKGQKEEAAELMQQYNKSREGGELKVNKALVERRAFESKLLTSGEEGDLSSMWRRRGKAPPQTVSKKEVTPIFKGNTGTNAMVLQALRDLNAELGQQAMAIQQEELWTQRIFQEGRGWQAQQ